MRRLFFTFLIMASPCAGQELDPWLRYMADLNRGSPLEGAGPKGSLGLNIGAGLQDQLAPVDAPEYTRQMRPLEEAQDAGRLHFVSLHKGTPWPLDVNVSYGQTGDGEVKRVGGTLQWTLLDIPRGISLSGRGAMHATTGFRDARIESREVDAVAGFGYGYINAYAVAGMADHVARIEKTAKHWQEPVGALGIQARLGSPFVVATVEWAYRDKAYRGLAAKLALGM